MVFVNQINMFQTIVNILLLHSNDLAILHTLAFCLLQFEQLEPEFQESILHNLPI